MNALHHKSSTVLECSVPKCENNSAQKQYAFHKLPTESNLRTRWIESCQKFGNWTPNDEHRICSAHFEKWHLYTTLGGGKRLKPRLKFRTAVPSIFRKRELPIDLRKRNLFKTIKKSNLSSNYESSYDEANAETQDATMNKSNLFSNDERSYNEANVETQDATIDLRKRNLFKIIRKPTMSSNNNESSCIEPNAETQDVNTKLGSSSDKESSCAIKDGTKDNCQLNQLILVLEKSLSNDKVSAKRKEMNITISRSGKFKTTNSGSCKVPEKISTNGSCKIVSIPSKTQDLLLELAECRKTIDVLTVNLEVANSKISCANELVDSFQEKLVNAHREIDSLTSLVAVMNNNLSKFLEEDQIMALYRGEHESIRNRSWSEETIMKSIKLKLRLGKQNYKYLMESGYPWPAYSTLNRRLKDAREQNTVIVKEQNGSVSQTESRTPLQTMENESNDSNLPERVAISNRKHLFNKLSSPIVKKISSSNSDDVVSDWKVVFVDSPSTSFMGDFLIDDTEDGL